MVTDDILSGCLFRLCSFGCILKESHSHLFANSSTLFQSTLHLDIVECMRKRIQLNFFIHLKVTYLILRKQNSSKFAWKFHQSKNCIVVLVSNLAMFRLSIWNHFTFACREILLSCHYDAFIRAVWKRRNRKRKMSYILFCRALFSSECVCVRMCSICSQDGMFLQMCPHQFIRYISFVCVTCVARLIGLQNVLNQR